MMQYSKTNKDSKAKTCVYATCADSKAHPCLSPAHLWIYVYFSVVKVFNRKTDILELKDWFVGFSAI